MGFLDKAKKLAEQAQTKLDEVQKQVNTSGGSGRCGPGPIVEYDKHGRPIPQQPQEATGGPQGDPLMGAHHAPPPAPTGPVVDPSAPSMGAPAPTFSDPLRRPAGPERSPPAPAAPSFGGDPLGAPPATSAPPAPAAPSLGGDPLGASPSFTPSAAPPSYSQPSTPPPAHTPAEGSWSAAAPPVSAARPSLPAFRRRSRRPARPRPSRRPSPPPAPPGVPAHRRRRSRPAESRPAEVDRRRSAGGLTAARAILSRMRPYEGLLTAMVTPFRADGSVDEEGAVAIGRHLLANGSHGLVVAGTTGEAATMTDEEHLGLIALIARSSGTSAS